MKRAIGWCALLALYVASEGLALLMGHHDRPTDRVVYPIYQALIRWSVRAQDWSGVNGPWSKP